MRIYDMTYGRFLTSDGDSRRYIIIAREFRADSNTFVEVVAKRNICGRWVTVARVQRPKSSGVGMAKRELFHCLAQMENILPGSYTIVKNFNID